MKQAGRQLTWKIAFSRVMPERPNLAVLDDWLAQVLEDDPGDESEEIYPGYDKIPVMTG